MTLGGREQSGPENMTLWGKGYRPLSYMSMSASALAFACVSARACLSLLGPCPLHTNIRCQQTCTVLRELMPAQNSQASGTHARQSTTKNVSVIKIKSEV